MTNKKKRLPKISTFEDKIIDYQDTNPEKTLGDLPKKKYKRKTDEYIECK